jgi:hypothetical protein
MGRYWRAPVETTPRFIGVIQACLPQTSLPAPGVSGGTPGAGRDVWLLFLATTMNCGAVSIEHPRIFKQVLIV